MRSRFAKSRAKGRAAGGGEPVGRKAPKRLLVASALLALAALAMTIVLGCSSPTGSEQVELVWSDEFDGPAGQSPDSTNWTFDIGTDWGNNQLEYDTDRPENVSLDGQGNLAITALEEDYLGSEYTSGRINTSGRFARTRGRFEARIKLPVGQGIWPAFWLLGAEFATVGWPECGEIDIMEYRGQLPSVVTGALHGPGYSGGSSIGGSYTLQDSTFNDGFHVFAIDWDTSSITWSVDDQEYLTISPSDLPQGSSWVFNDDFFIILNVAVGGNYVGPPDATTTFPQTMLVDYVRVYGTTE
ncbi:MAG: family 16 glycosylhydrolase [Candidatus Eisenbacteria bacterium]|nr:family 16 glycosylhydrolase [Candidatus Eisenbacteria bacterium]